MRVDGSITTLIGVHVLGATKGPNPTIAPAPANRKKNCIGTGALWNTWALTTVTPLAIQLPTNASPLAFAASLARNWMVPKPPTDGVVLLT